MDEFTRKELMTLREKAIANAMIPAENAINPLWKRAYLRLADAADHLDAMMARCEEREDGVVYVEEM
jgi:hypothetical protein